jgi:O-antigen/teichoic acid export membrane protein
LNIKPNVSASVPKKSVRVWKNLIANYCGQGWSAIMALAFMPLYIDFLGIEAFGLVGFYITIQMLLSVFDLGITPTLNREMARFRAGELGESQVESLLSTLEICVFFIATFIFIGLWFYSDIIASSWLTFELLSQSTVSDSIVLMGIAISVRFIESIYKGSLLGLEEQVWFNVVNASMATLRFGGVVVLLANYSSTIQVFFYWQVLISLLSLVILRNKTLTILRTGKEFQKFDVRAIKSVQDFASGMFGITVLSLLLTQSDKFILSKLLTLENFSYYTIAVTIAGSLYVLITPITQAFYPRMVSMVATGNEKMLRLIFHQATQLINVLILPIVLTITLFSESIILAWSGNQMLADNSSPILSIYIIGSYLNGLVNIPYHLQLAHGWTSLALKMNLITLLFLMPLIIIVTPIFGAIGAAYLWVAINIIYFIVGTLIMFRRLLKDAKNSWFIFDIGLPSLAMCCTAYLLFLLIDIDSTQRLLSLLTIATITIFIMLIGILCSSKLHDLIRAIGGKKIKI